MPSYDERLDAAIRRNELHTAFHRTAAVFYDRASDQAEHHLLEAAATKNETNWLQCRQRAIAAVEKRMAAWQAQNGQGAESSARHDVETACASVDELEGPPARGPWVDGSAADAGSDAATDC
jgi:hypothetical protein